MLEFCVDFTINGRNVEEIFLAVLGYNHMLWKNFQKPSLLTVASIVNNSLAHHLYSLLLTLIHQLTHHLLTTVDS